MITKSYDVLVPARRPGGLRTKRCFYHDSCLGWQRCRRNSNGDNSPIDAGYDVCSNIAPYNEPDKDTAEISCKMWKKPDKCNQFCESMLKQGCAATIVIYDRNSRDDSNCATLFREMLHTAGFGHRNNDGSLTAFDDALIKCLQKAASKIYIQS